MLATSWVKINIFKRQDYLETSLHTSLSMRRVKINTCPFFFPCSKNEDSLKMDNIMMLRMRMLQLTAERGIPNHVLFMYIMEATLPPTKATSRVQQARTKCCAVLNAIVCNI
ncbi:hypothetical protein U1Q18_026938 [Sarracenia purpurea var. burkii]